MLIDRQLRFSSAQAITATAASTDLIDLATSNRDLGVGTPIWLVVVVTTAFTDTNSDSTITVTVQSDDDVAFGSATTVQTISPVFAALSAVGAIRVVQLHPIPTDERYLRLTYTTTNGDLSAGAFTAFLTNDPHNWVARPDGFVIS
jgi:hypothetical protein